MNELVRNRDLKDLPEMHRHISVTQGFSGVEVFYFPELSAYLKIGKTGRISDLGRERDVLCWLDGKFPVPRVIGYESYGSSEALLISETAGVPGSNHISGPSAKEQDITDFAKAAAAALRRLHDLPIKDCPFDMTLDVRFELSRRSIELDLISETNSEFMARHGGMAPWDVYYDLIARRPETEDLVFTHGDPCMPNIIVNDGGIAGFIDMDGAGIADRYADIAIFLRSFRRNSRLAIDLENVFLEGYGIDRLNQWKIEYYRTFDDLF